MIQIVVRRKLRIFILAVLVLACSSCDLATKWLAKSFLHHAAPIQIIKNYIELRYTENTAIAFSMLQSIDDGLRLWIIYSLSSVAMGFLIYLIWKFRKGTFLPLIALMLILSGAIGNISERIMRGYVIDFIHLHYFDKFSWPVFNVADILITIGAVLLGLFMLKYNDETSESEIFEEEQI
ncbi:signal peptidase II [candidate division KSB1 bacterium 4484_87]|nr:MAG: signal peptidase II [candidate division KSB1 bacterium 4484_87]